VCAAKKGMKDAEISGDLRDNEANRSTFAQLATLPTSSVARS